MSLPGDKCKVSTTYSLKQGDILFHEGTAASEMFFIESGKLKITKRVLNRSIKLGELEEGEFVGELAVLGGGLRSATAQAYTDCKVSTLDKNTCQQCFNTLPPCMHTLMERLAQRLQQTDELVVKVARILEIVKGLAEKMEMLEDSILEDTPTNI